MKDAAENIFPLVSSQNNYYNSSEILTIPVTSSQPKSEEILTGPSEITSLPHSSDTSKAQKRDFLQQLEDGDSVNITDVKATSLNVSSSASGEAKISENDHIHIVTPYELSYYEVEIESVANKHVEEDVNRGFVDTAPPFESVKEAVSKFGGFVDWKAHRVQIVERRKHVEEELEKAQEVILEYKKRSEAAEDEKAQVLKELDTTKRLIEELKLNLERGKIEEDQAKQDSKLAKLRVKEMEQGVSDESSIAAKAQLEVAKTRYEDAVLELKCVRGELEELQIEYGSLIIEKDMAMKRAEEVFYASKKVEKIVEELSMELMEAKESLESAHSAHLEAEELRIGAAMAKAQDSLKWQNELKEAEKELQKLNLQLLSVKELKSKLDTSSSLLLDLKAELGAYMEAKVKKEMGKEERNSNFEVEEESKENTHLDLAKKELEEVKLKIKKATAEVSCFRVAAMTLKLELEKGKSALATVGEREGMELSSLEAELNMTMSEIALVQMREKKAREKMMQLPKKLQDVAQEADEAKSITESSCEELLKVKEEVELVKASESVIKRRLNAALKEIEASIASEKLALQASMALQESEDVSNGVTLSLEEYYELSKRAREAEVQANLRVANVISQLELAKESEVKSMEKLEEVNREMDSRKEEQKIAMEKAEKAKEGKLGVEQELRKWRNDHEKRRKDSETGNGFRNSIKSPRRSLEEMKEEKRFDRELELELESESYLEENTGKKKNKKNKNKKESLFPRLVMFLGRKKANRVP